jgi:Na+/alanine symporter
MTQTFIDTIIVVVSFTGIVIITTGAWKTGETGSDMTAIGFDHTFLEVLVNTSSRFASSSSSHLQLSLAAGATTVSGAWSRCPDFVLQLRSKLSSLAHA